MDFGAISKSCSSTKSHFVRGEHIWILEDFLRLEPFEDSVTSEDFYISRDTSSGKERLAFKLSLNFGKSGLQDNATTYLETCLKWVPSGIKQSRQKIKVQFGFAILDKDGGPFLESTDTANSIFCKKDNIWGIEKTFEREEIISNSQKILPNGSLRLRCFFKVFCDYPQDSSQARVRIDNELKDVKGTLTKSFANLLESGELSDVKLICLGVTFYCHKLVLATRSEVFKAMFTHKSIKEQQTNTVRIDDATPDSVLHMLKFIYSDDCEGINEHAFGLFTLADKYDLCSLKLMCEEWLADNISVSNAADILLLSERHNSDKLFQVTKVFVVSHMDCVKHTEGWKCIREKHPRIMADLLESLSLPHFIPPGNRQSVSNSKNTKNAMQAPQNKGKKRPIESDSSSDTSSLLEEEN